MPSVRPSPKVAVYSCNFGNYRNELQQVKQFNKFDARIDYFFFTDRPQLAQLASQWTIIRRPLIESSFMASARQTSKHVKFMLPEELSAYDIIVWLDSSKLRRVLYDNICSLFEKYPGYDVFNLRHPQRKTMQDELRFTLRWRIENASGSKFLQTISDFKSDFDLPETCVIVRRNQTNVNDAFAKCYGLINEYHLKRDQNVYNFALHGIVVPKVLPTIAAVLNES